MEKERLKEPYLEAKTEITHIYVDDIIQTSGEAGGWDGSNTPSGGWT